MVTVPLLLIVKESIRFSCLLFSFSTAANIRVFSWGFNSETFSTWNVSVGATPSIISVSLPCTIRTLPGESFPALFLFPALSVATALRCQLFLPFLSYSRLSFKWALTVIRAGLAVVAVIFPVKCSTVPVPYLLSSKKLFLRAEPFASAFETILNSDNCPLLSVAVKLIWISSPAYTI